MFVDLFHIIVRDLQEWLPREFEESLSLEIFNSHMDMILGSLLEWGFGHDDLKIPFPTSALL